jgi:DNA helicase HerA-like ATPase
MKPSRGVLNLVFKIADDNAMLLLDLKDLRAMLQYVGDNAKEFTTAYGNVSAASVGAIQRGLLQIGQRDFWRADAGHQRLHADGGWQGVNILTADKLMNSPPVRHLLAVDAVRAVRAAPEIGDPEKPSWCFFDEAHLLFNEAPKVLVERIELVVRLVRPKASAFTRRKPAGHS